MRLWILIGGLLLATQAVAQAPVVRNLSYCDDVHTPPAEFDYEPIESYGIVPLPPYAVSHMCNANWSRVGSIGACVDFQDEGDEPTIWVRNDLTPTEYVCVIRHERAHINGWVHGHSTKPYPEGRQGAIVRYTPKP